MTTVSEEKVREVIDQFITPAVQQDGGLIELVGVEGGTVKVMLQGACASCPSSLMTLTNGVERLLKEKVPGVENVVAVDPLLGLRDLKSPGA